MKKKATVKKAIEKKPASVPYHRKPADMTLEAWQIALRRQFVTDKQFIIKKLDGHEVFSDYSVFNPETKNSYKVALRSREPYLNFCSCLDFKTNHLGTCKHIEAVLLQVGSDNRLKVLLERGYIPGYSSVFLHYGKERKIKLRIGTNFTGKLKKAAGDYFDETLTLTPFGFANFEKFQQKALLIDREFRCYDDAMAYILETRERQHRSQLVSEHYPTGKKLDTLISATLFPYQKEGILFSMKAGRSMICDEMGLGKTIQAIGVSQLFKLEQGITRVLICCPTSLKYQWQSEIKKFTEQTALVIEGMPHVRSQQYRMEHFYKIVSYHTLSNDLNFINSQEFDLVILDEAQRIKNWKTKIAQSVKKIRSPYAIVLTGTPLENKLEELYSIVQFVDPFKLGPYYHFLDYYQLKNDTGRVTGYRHLHEISARLSDIMIRRSKKEVMSQLPERMDKILFVSMTEKQMDFHTEFADTVARLVNKWIRQGFLIEKDRQRLMISLNMMRMVCDSTYILDQQTRHDTKIDELMTILDEYFDGTDEKVVIFSQWERMTRLVAAELDQRGIGYRYLHGGVPSRDRKELFEHFNQEPSCRVFLSTDAGSTGLNLQSASMVINLDIPWNPAVLEQRIGRVHRYGQEKKVSVINFVSTGTIEHRMINVLQFKTSLFDGILNNGEDSIFMSEDKFREFMKTVESITTSPVPEEIPATTIPSDIEIEADELNTPETAPPRTGQLDLPLEQTFPGDDDILTAETTPPADSDGLDKIPAGPVATSLPEPVELIAKGLSFFSGLAQTLSSPEATQKLVTSLVEKDPETGKACLKIPIENEKVISDALTLFGQIFKTFSKS